MNQTISTDTDINEVCESNSDGKLIFSYEEALSSSVEYFDGDELAAKVFVDKYAMRDNDMNLVEKTPYDMHVRIATEFARIEKKKFKDPMTFDEIFSYLDHFKYIVPQGSPMYGVGNKYQTVSVGNCFVLDSPYDSYSGILKTDEELVQLSKRRGGVGIDISTLRPSGAKTHNAAHTSTGVPSFMERYSNSIREVGQNGRRGALMISISVHHPDIEDFISIKSDLTKVTGANISIRLSDEFLNAVENDEEYEVKFPVDSDNPETVEMVSAKYIWDKIIHSAHAMAEPGILFWSNIIKESPADCYAEDGFKSISTNPCFSGDTLIGVADGRNSVSLRDLAKEGKDVPVYSVDTSTGKVSIKWGRNPRITGYNKKIIRVHLDDKTHIDVTTDHKFPLLNGDTVEAKDLKSGDSLHRFTKLPEYISKTNKSQYYSVCCDTLNLNKEKIYEHRLVSKFHWSDRWNELYSEQSENEWLKGGIVVHHKDYNSLNNSPDNLEIMTFKDHQQLHADMDSVGENNGKYYGHTNEDIEKLVLSLTRKLGRRIEQREWRELCCENRIPKAFSSWRKNGWFSTYADLTKWAAEEYGFECANEDPRTIKTHQDMLKQGYSAKIENREVLVEKTCEGCKCDFYVEHGKREQSYCCISCFLNIVNHDSKKMKKRTDSSAAFYKNKQENLKIEQVKAYSMLEFELKRKPLMREWENYCRDNNIPFRMRTKYGFQKYADIKEKANSYNHKVSFVEELEDTQDVYNITVDDNHTVAIVTGVEECKSGNNGYTGIFALQCGEVILSAEDSCRLLLLNLFSYVDKPFTPKAKFDFDKFHSHVQVAQRLMDNLIDIEIECVEKIIKKIKNDPEPKEVKIRELNLWKRVRDVAIRGRRTGTGVTAIGDTLAALGIPYTSRKGLNAVEKIYKTLKLGSYRSSVDMAKELGTFSAWDYEKEKKNPFLLRIKDEDPSLYRDMKKYGRRNIALLTTAPAGSVSLLTQTSSGIEPQFMIEPYTRRKKGNPGDENFRSDFIDQSGDHWMEFQVFPPKVKMWMEITGETDLDKSPWRGSTAPELEWRERVKLQSLAQKNVDHSISSTTNLPNDATVEDVDAIYRTAWKSGCKGITIYRDGCRTGVLVSNEDDREGDNDIIPQTEAPKRKRELPCEVHHTKVRGVPYFVVVGLLNGDPYEVFAGINHINGHSVEGDDPEEIVIPRPFQGGIIRKEKRGHYNAILNSKSNTELTIRHIGQRISDDEAALTRLISTSLRHGAAINFVVHQLEKVTGDMTSFGKSIARALKKYIPDGTEVTGEECPNCEIKENTIIRQEGCILCKKCGWTKCG